MIESLRGKEDDKRITAAPHSHYGLKFWFHLNNICIVLQWFVRILFNFIQILCFSSQLIGFWVGYTTKSLFTRSVNIQLCFQLSEIKYIYIYYVSKLDFKDNNLLSTLLKCKADLDKSIYVRNLINHNIYNCW